MTFRVSGPFKGLYHGYLLVTRATVRTTIQGLLLPVAVAGLFSTGRFQEYQFCFDTLTIHWVLHDARHYPIVVHCVVRGGTFLNTSVLGMLTQGITLVTVRTMQEMSRTLLYKMGKRCKYQWFGHACTRHERL